MNSNLQLVKSAQFNGVTFNCYKETDEQNSSDFWATREQIGQLLEYEYPRESIGKIHERNKERLDKFSSEVKLTTEAGQRTAMIYNFKGLFEICRYSNQPKANEVMDFLWEIADEIRRTGSYSSKSNNSVIPDIRIDGAIKILELAGIKDNQLVLALDKMYRSYTGKSVLLTTGIELEAPVKEQALTLSKIAELLGIGNGNAGGRIVNALLEDAGYQRKVAGQWEPTELGKPYALVLDTNKKFSNGTPIIQVKWYTSINEIVKKLAQGLINH